MEILRDVFDYEISKGSVHNIIYSVFEKCKKIGMVQKWPKIGNKSKRDPAHV